MKSTLQIGQCGVVRAKFIGAVHDGEELSLIEESTGYYDVPCSERDFEEVAKTEGLFTAGNGLVDPSRVRIAYRRDELIHITFETRHTAKLVCASNEEAKRVLAKLLAAMERLGPRYTEIAHLAREQPYLGGGLYMVISTTVTDAGGRRSEAAVEPEAVLFTRSEAEAWVKSDEERRNDEEYTRVYSILEVMAAGALSEIVGRMTIKPPSDGVPF